MALASTVWPDEPVPGKIKNWLSEFFRIVDENVLDAPQKFTSMLTDDASLRTGAGTATGRAEILALRSTAWDHVASRKHEVLRVYVSKRDYTDILLVGRLEAKYKNGNDLSTEFIARVGFVVQDAGRVAANLYQVWVDSAPHIRAMRSD